MLVPAVKLVWLAQAFMIVSCTRSSALSWRPVSETANALKLGKDARRSRLKPRSSFSITVILLSPTSCCVRPLPAFREGPESGQESLLLAPHRKNRGAFARSMRWAVPNRVSTRCVIWSCPAFFCSHHPSCGQPATISSRDNVAWQKKFHPLRNFFWGPTFLDP